jgi:hypothetical protein
VGGGSGAHPAREGEAGAGREGRRADHRRTLPEAKEFLAGFWVVDVETLERACEIAAKASAAPGPGGDPLYMPIEVRQVMGGAPSAES